MHNTGDNGYVDWVRDFQQHAERRHHAVAPPWQLGRAMPDAVVRSVQRFQAGEDGDGASLIAKSAHAGDPLYLQAVRLFVAEEQNHARLLERLLVNSGASTISGHWSDTVFVALRRAGGLRLELMTLMVAEVVALRYYRALRDGATDPALADVAGRILADERRHVPFHTQRLREFFVGRPPLVRAVTTSVWWLVLMGAAGVVAIDHGAALRQLGVPPTRFFADTVALFRTVVTEVTASSGTPQVSSPRSAAAGERRPPTPAASRSAGTAPARTLAHGPDRSAPPAAGRR